MGRKGAPEPLSLPDDSAGPRRLAEAYNPANNTSNTNTNAHTNTNINTNPTTNATYSNTLALSDSTSVSRGQERLSPASFQHASTTPTSSRSPRSPHSPFGKTNASSLRTPQTPIHSHSPSEPQAETSSQLIGANRPLYSVDDVSAHQPYHHIRQDIGNRPKTSAGQQPSIAKQQPSQQPSQQKRGVDHSRSASRFWGFGKSSKAANQFRHTHANSSNDGMSRGFDYPPPPDKVLTKKNKSSDTDLSSAGLSSHKATIPLPARSDASLTSTGDYEHPNSRKTKPKPFGLLGRNRSLKEQEEAGAKDPSAMKDSDSEKSSTHHGLHPLKTATAPLEGFDRSLKHVKNSSVRNQSADRALARDVPGNNKDVRNDKEQNRSHPSSYREASGSNFILNGLKNSGSWAFDMGKQFFGKGTRSGNSSTGHPNHAAPPADYVDDEHYVLKVINLPLVEQTRLTRISKRLEDSRDKTEFWMPAFPWRAIDYLNYKGTEVEGLYRVPGSGPQIKKWQRKFDEDGDVDLFAQDDLYDINIVGSMLKAWLRELPDELFPKEAQERIARECTNSEEVPQLLVEELSNLSPFNYYLLFAITCHLSLLLAHSDKNKMDFRNLCICFQPCMKIDAFCFKFLVCDWRHCWQGCKNEARYIEEEYMILDQPIPKVLHTGPHLRTGTPPEDRTLSSSDSSKQSTLGQEPPQDGHPRKKPLAAGPSNGSMASNSTAATSFTAPTNYPNDNSNHSNGDNSREVPASFSSELRPLSPIKPLSPLGF